MTASTRCGLVAVAVSVLSAGAAVAQPQSGPVLNALEVRLLSVSASPQDQDRLARHFTALADQFDAEGVRHERMRQSTVALPRQQVVDNLRLHCSQLAKAAHTTAGHLRAVADYYAERGRGVTPPVPPEADLSIAMAYADPPTDAEVEALVALATTPDAHRMLADYFQAVANASAASEVDHLQMGNIYRGTRLSVAAVHCDELARVARRAASHARAAAMAQEQLIGVDHR